MMQVLTTWDTLEAIRDRVLKEDLSAVMDIAAILACIMCAFAILKVVKIYMTGQNMDPWDLFKPLIVLILVCNFNTLILSPVNSLTSIVSRESAEIFDMRPDKYISKWADNMSNIGSTIAQENRNKYLKELEKISEDDDWFGIKSWFQKLWLGIKKAIMDLFNISSLGVAGLIGGILFLLVKILLYAQQILCALYLLINSLIGPFVLALSIMPGFESGFKNWFARYFQLSMWIPVGYMVLGINLSISDHFSSLATEGGMTIGLQWMMLVLQMAALVTITAVPKMVTWIIHVPGSSDAHGFVSGMAKRAVKAS